MVGKTQMNSAKKILFHIPHSDASNDLINLFFKEVWSKMFPDFFSSLQLPEKIQPEVSTHQNL